MRLSHGSFAVSALLSACLLRNTPFVAKGNRATRQEGALKMKKFVRDFAALCVMMVVTAAIVSFQYVPYL
jgi:hypothetical protein